HMPHSVVQFHRQHPVSDPPTCGHIGHHRHLPRATLPHPVRDRREPLGHIGIRCRSRHLHVTSREIPVLAGVTRHHHNPVPRLRSPHRDAERDLHALYVTRQTRV